MVGGLTIRRCATPLSIGSRHRPQTRSVRSRCFVLLTTGTPQRHPRRRLPTLVPRLHPHRPTGPDRIDLPRFAPLSDGSGEPDSSAIYRFEGGARVSTCRRNSPSPVPTAIPLGAQAMAVADSSVPITATVAPVAEFHSRTMVIDDRGVRRAQHLLPQMPLICPGQNVMGCRWSR